VKRTKKLKTTKAPRIARKPKSPIDPRLQRVFDVLDEAWGDGDLGRSWDGLATALWEVAIGAVPSNEPVKRFLAMALENAYGS
jgi:hypothetical protein